MAIDPDEIKKGLIKRQQQIDEIQNYLEEQHALDSQNAAGKLGTHQVKKEAGGAEIAKVMDLRLKFLT